MRFYASTQGHRLEKARLRRTNAQSNYQPINSNSGVNGHPWKYHGIVSVFVFCEFSKRSRLPVGVFLQSFFFAVLTFWLLVLIDHFGAF